MSAGYTTLDRCLACGGTDLKLFWDGGTQPLANDFRSIPTKQTLVEWTDYPLALNVCTECFHSQQRIAVDPATLYTNYNYVSGTSSSLRHYFAEFVDRVERDFDRAAFAGFPAYTNIVKPDKLPGDKLRVLEIACNDGTLLKRFADRGHSVLGVEPAGNVAAVARVELPVVESFWNEYACAAALGRGGTYDVVVAMNVLGHVGHPTGGGPLTFLQLAKQVLAPGGRIYAQTSQAHMIERGEFDTAYHEHISFFTARSFKQLAKRAGLGIANVEIVDVHGGSYLVTLVDSGFALFDDTGIARWQAQKNREQDAGLYDPTAYDAFQQKTRDVIDLTRQILNTYRAGRRVVGYGAAAKSMTFVNALQAWVNRFPSGDRVPKPPIDYFVDDAPLKQNTLCPGTGIPVYAPERLDAEIGPILFVVTAWNMAPEIIERIKARRPGKRDLFFTYFPTIGLHV